MYSRVLICHSHAEPQSTHSGNGHFLAYIPLHGKISPAWWGEWVHALPLSLYLPSQTKLWYTLQLRGQRLYISPISAIPLYCMYSMVSTFVWMFFWGEGAAPLVRFLGFEPVLAHISSIYTVQCLPIHFWKMSCSGSPNKDINLQKDGGVLSTADICRGIIVMAVFKGTIWYIIV